MQVTIATPLFPPDTGSAAVYAKELARRLADLHEVTVVTYGHLPEPVASVQVVAVDKRRMLPLRLVQYIRELFAAARKADVVYVLNGPAVELPAGLVLRLARAPYVVGLADAAAHRRAGQARSLHLIERLCLSGSRARITEFPLPRPEIIPFEPRPEAALAAYEQSWTTHLELLESSLRHACTD